MIFVANANELHYKNNVADGVGASASHLFSMCHLPVCRSNFIGRVRHTTPSWSSVIEQSPQPTFR